MNKLTKEQIAQAVLQYADKKVLPFNKIPCTVTGKEVYMFGTNLHKRVERYGSVQALLEGFVSREGRRATAAPKTAKAPRKAKKVSERPTELTPEEIDVIANV